MKEVNPPRPHIFSEQIEKFSELEENWDSYNAKKISSVSILKSLSILASIMDKNTDNSVEERMLPYSVVPLATGGVQMTWRGLDLEIDVEVGGMGEIGYLLVDKDVQNQDVTDLYSAYTEVDNAEDEDVIKNVLRVIES